MAEDNGDRYENGSKDRATVALVDAKVATVDAKVSGILTLLTDMRVDMRALGVVAGQVIKLESTVESQGRRIETLEKRSDAQDEDRDEAEQSAREYRRYNLPSLLIAGGAAIAAIAALAQQIFH